MDFEMMMQMDALQQTFGFLRNVFPWVTLVVLLFTTVSVALAEKRKRALVLERSREQERIEALDIDAEEKERLLRAAAPLPESREAYPLPDLPLRLVSALAKVFGFLQIALFLGAVYGMARIAAFPEATRTASHPVLACFLFAGFIVLAVLQIMASTRVTRGSNRARRFLIFMAVVNLGTVAFMGMPFAWLWRTVIVAMSAYTLWVLLLRKRSQRAVMHDYRPTRAWQKAAVALVCLVSLFSDPLDFKATANASSQKMESNSSTMNSGGINMPVRRVVLQAGDAGKDTWKLMELLGDALDVPAELVRFEGMPGREIRGDDLYLLVSKTVDTKRGRKKDKSLNRHMLKVLAKNHPELAGGFALSANYDAKVAFDVRALFAHDFFARNHEQSEMREMGAPSIKLAQSAEYSGKSRDAILVDISAAIGKTLNQFIGQQEHKATLRAFPEALVSEPASMPAPEFEFMRGAVREAEYREGGHQLQLYRVGEFSPEYLSTVTNQLAEAGWKHRWDGQFKKGTEQISIQGNARYDREVPLPYLHLVHAQSEKEAFSEADRIALCRENYADFIALFPATAVPDEVLFQATLEYLEKSNLSATELYRVYDLAQHSEKLKGIRPALLLRFARMLHEEPMNEWTFELYGDLAEAITEDRRENLDVRGRIEELYGDRIVHLELRPGTNGLDRAEVLAARGERPLLLTISKTRNEPTESREFFPFYHLSWVVEREDGTYKNHTSMPRGGGTSEGAKLDASYANLHGFSMRGSECNGRSWGALPATREKWVEKNVKPGDLCVTYDPMARSNQVHIVVIFNDDRMVVSRAADGAYFLNKDRMTEDELFTALMRRQVRDDKLGVLAVLDKSDREEFEAVLSDLPRNRRRTVKYVDPAPTATE